MRSSRAEIKIEDILRDAGINFQEQYSFPDLLSDNNHSLRFDFAIFDDDGIKKKYSILWNISKKT